MADSRRREQKTQGSGHARGDRLCGGGGLVAKLCPTLGTPWTIACKAYLSMGFPRQEYWSGLPCPPPGDLPNLGIEAAPPALAGGFFYYYYFN